MDTNSYSGNIIICHSNMAIMRCNSTLHNLDIYVFNQNCVGGFICNDCQKSLGFLSWSTELRSRRRIWHGGDVRVAIESVLLWATILSLVSCVSRFVQQWCVAVYVFVGPSELRHSFHAALIRSVSPWQLYSNMRVLGRNSVTFTEQTVDVSNRGLLYTITAYF